ncbi:efflux RND transporter permease subunit [Reinekea sp.]|jgi:hydrophobe/amphiphile efflux-3 (HAE3) family protein|uniref:efflux RND transporter permease subunit n=1 Tax=Reinekea sp. TaxID=1970455 RepID=UPI002A833403|nr:efflux RND transporter permease subunit [Reinekea sp.]
MNSISRGWANLVLKGRWAILAIFAGAIALSIGPMSNIDYDNSNQRFFIAGDENLVNFNHLIELFGDNDYLSIGIQARPGDLDVFEPETLAMIELLTGFVEDHAIVTQVRSLTRYQYTHNDDGMLATDELLLDLADPAEIENARQIMANETLALGTLITPDYQHTRIVARTEYRKNLDDHKVAFVHELEQFISEHGFSEQGYTLRLGGQPKIDEQFETLSVRDTNWINPTMALIMIVILFISFRSISATLLPWLVIGGSIVMVSGIQGVIGWPHSVVESALVPALIIIGVGVSVHVLVEFYHFRAQDKSPKQAALETVDHLLVPAFFTAFTTSAGFLALGVTKLVPVKEFAMLGSIGSMLLFIIALTVLPALLSFIPWFSERTQKVVDQGFITRLTQKVPAFTFKNRVRITILGAIILLASVVTVPNIEVDSNYITYFKENNPTRQALSYFDEQYKGIQNIDVIIDSGEFDGIKAPAFLARVDAFQQWLEQQANVGDANSLIDFLKEISESINDDDPSYYRLPDSSNMTAQYLFLYENTGAEEDLSDLKDFDYQYVRIAVPIKNMKASLTSDLLDKINNKVAADFADLDVTLTGSLVMFNAQDNYINQGMLQSFMVALVVIGISFIVLFRSLKYGAIALVPSIVPILITGSLLVVFDIPLNLGTMIVGAMTMGIAVDDAIHVMSRYLISRKQGANTHDAITRAMTESGRAVVFTSIVLVTGFSVMLLGSFVPYIYTGMFAASVMALALIGDLIFLPAILYLVDGEKEHQPETDKTKQPTQTIT